MPDAPSRALSKDSVPWLLGALVAEAIVVAWFGIWLAVQIHEGAPADTIGTLFVVAVFVVHSGGTITVVSRVDHGRSGAWLPAHVVSGAVLFLGGLWLVRDRWLGVALAAVGLVAAVTAARCLRADAIWPPDRIIPALLGAAALVLAAGAVFAPAEPGRHALVSCRAPLIVVFGGDQHLGGHILVSDHGEQPEVARVFCLPGSRRRLAFTFVVAPASTIVLRGAWRGSGPARRTRS